ncbi:mRNA 3' end processing factor [Metarhizium acridum]|nr:mRNA 3' end processing factor [Metarhizium acridum]
MDHGSRLSHMQQTRQIVRNQQPHRLWLHKLHRRQGPFATYVAAKRHFSYPLQQKRSASSFFSTPAPKRIHSDGKALAPLVNGTFSPVIGKKRSFEEGPGAENEGSGPSAADQKTKENGVVNGHGKTGRLQRGPRRNAQPLWPRGCDPRRSTMCAARIL